jgi:hypothetical protein
MHNICVIEIIRNYKIYIKWVWLLNKVKLKLINFRNKHNYNKKYVKINNKNKNRNLINFVHCSNNKYKDS